MKELEETGWVALQNPARSKQWLQFDTTLSPLTVGHHSEVQSPKEHYNAGLRFGTHIWSTCLNVWIKKSKTVNRSEDLSLPLLKVSAIQSLVWLPLLHSGRQAYTPLALAAMATLLGFFMLKGTDSCLGWKIPSVRVLRILTGLHMNSRTRFDPAHAHVCDQSWGAAEPG